jgi:DNA polymerase-3 subunit epsilon
MRILFFDTETTGLPDFKKPSDDPCQPRITQICAELVSEDTGEVYAGLHTLIAPDGWTIPEKLEKLTGITNEKCRAVGLPMDLVLPLFIDLWTKADGRVAHNESFDMRMVRIELFRHKAYGDKFADHWKAGAAYCTMTRAKPIMNLPPSPKMVAAGMRGPKSPNLGEAYRHFTGEDLENAHNAAVDVMACKAVYFALKKAA